MTDLNIPGAMAIGINDSGWIVANNLSLNRAYLLRPSSVSLAPTGLSFGNGVIGAASSPQTATCGACTLTLTNGTGAAIAVAGLTVIGPFASTSNSCPASLAAGASCTVNLSFTPSGPDTNAGAVSITAGGTPYAALLTGIGMNIIKLTASASTVAIGVPFTLTWSGTSGASIKASAQIAFNSSGGGGGGALGWMSVVWLALALAARCATWRPDRHRALTGSRNCL